MAIVNFYGKEEGNTENCYLPAYLTNLPIWTHLELHPIAILHILLSRDNSDSAEEDWVEDEYRCVDILVGGIPL
jgi:hypothetical protein